MSPQNQSALPYRKSRFYPSLTEVQMIGGVERSFAILNGTLTLMLVMRSGFWGFLLMGITFHVILRSVTRNDPLIRLVYQRFIKQGHRYDPWPSAAKSANQRPEGFDPGGLC